MDQNSDNGLDIGYSSDVTIDHCVIAVCGSDGINANADTLTILNSGIVANDGVGVNISQCSSTSEIRNCTIIENSGKAIDATYSTYAPDVRNCIFWDNNNSAAQYSGILPEYSCIENETVPNNYYNINSDPCFAYDDPNNFHITGDSLCIDRGDNTNVVTGETDIDNEDRINDPNVDMGADEYYGCDSGISCTLDVNADGVVNLKEFALIASAWLKDNTDPNWTDTYARLDFNADNEVNLDDLLIFVDSTNAETFGHWLWQACWYNTDSTAVAMMRTAPIPEATILTDEQIESNRQAKWQKNQPEREYTTYETMLMVEDIIEIIENDWLTNPDFQKEVTEDQYKESMQMLYDWLEELLTEWKSELSKVSLSESKN